MIRDISYKISCLFTLDWWAYWCLPWPTSQHNKGLASSSCLALSHVQYNNHARPFDLTHTHTLLNLVIRKNCNSSGGRETRKVYEPRRKSKSAKLTHYEPLLGCDHFYVEPFSLYEPYVQEISTPSGEVRRGETQFHLFCWLIYVYFIYIFQNIRTQRNYINQRTISLTHYLTRGTKFRT